LRLRRGPRLDDTSWSFFVFFCQDDIFMALALALWEEVAVVCAGSGARARQLIKFWAATTRAGPRAFTINAGAEAQASPHRSATSA
jgi:hypothetical protein